MGGRGANLKDSSGDNFSYSKYADMSCSIIAGEILKENEEF